MAEEIPKKKNVSFQKQKKNPVIEGIFVKSYSDAPIKEKGKEGIRLLGEKYGKPVNFKNSEDVQGKEEMKIPKLVYEILYGNSLSEQPRAFEVGRLHFNNLPPHRLRELFFPCS